MTEIPDILEKKRVKHQRQRRRGKGIFKRGWYFLTKSIRWRVIFIFFIVAVIVGIGGQSVLIADAANQLNGSFNSTMRVVRSVSSKSGTDLTLADFGRLQTSLQELSRNLNQVDGRVNTVRWVTTLNPDWRIMLESLQIARNLTSATINMLDGLEPALFYMVGGQRDETVVTQITSGERIVELLSIGRGRFNLAATELRQARQHLDRLELSQISPSLLLQIQSLEGYHGQLSEINQLLIQAPDILTVALGLDDTQNYLLLSQNSDELRPSGGYVSTYGWMTVRNGRIVEYAYYPTTVDTPQPPPTDFDVAVTVPDWWIQYTQPIFAMWDGSWYASFPRTAEMARNYYNAGSNPATPINAVIAIDIRGFEHILEALESVIVERMTDDGPSLVTVTATNFRDIIYDIRADEGAHKAFIADLYNEIFAQWQSRSGDPRMNQAFLGIVLEALLQKHIMIYSNDPQLNEALDILGWSGKQEPAVDQDYLMIADANLGNKSNRSIIRRTTYDVTINEADTLTSRVSISYDYPDAIARTDPAIDPQYHGPRDYNNLMQIFVPQGSTLVSSENFGGNPFTVDDDTHTIFTSRVRVPYDTTQRYQVTYETPGLVDSVGPYRRYQLLIQKQPGMLPEKVDAQVSLPAGSRIVAMSPEPVATYALDTLILDFRLELTSDIWLEIIFDG